MVTKRQELIDFLDWYRIARNMSSDCMNDEWVDRYLKKSINSNESDELRAVGNNEQTKEVCKHTSNTFNMEFGGYTCDFCGCKC